MTGVAAHGLLNILIGTALVTGLAIPATPTPQMCARLLALMSFAVGLMPAVTSHEDLTTRVALLLGSHVLLKGIIFPLVLLRVCRDVETRRGFGSFVGGSGGIVIGVLCLSAAAWVGSAIGSSLPEQPVGVYIVALFLILSGLFVIIVCKRAVMQVIGYLTLENGVYLFGSSAVLHVPLLLEFGVLLDVFAAVFVMGTALRQIHAELHTDDATRLSELQG